jgi:putative effector of murein hydrolase LrgA (UPF0299 family)
MLQLTNISFARKISNNTNTSLINATIIGLLVMLINLNVKLINVKLTQETLDLEAQIIFIPQASFDAK